MGCPETLLFDYLIGSRMQLIWDGQSKRLAAQPGGPRSALGHSLPIPLVSALRDGVLKTASFTQLSPASPDVVFSKLCSTNSDVTY